MRRVRRYFPASIPGAITVSPQAGHTTSVNGSASGNAAPHLGQRGFWTGLAMIPSALMTTHSLCVTLAQERDRALDARLIHLMHLGLCPESLRQGHAKRPAQMFAELPQAL